MKIYLGKIRREKGISTRKLAVLSGVARSYIIKLEAGRANPTMDILCKLSNALEVNVHSLFDC